MLRLLLFGCFVLISLVGSANCLTQAVTIECKPCSMEEALERLESQINCTFSYSTDQINPEQSVTISAKDAPLIQVLESISNKTLSIKQRSRYILLTPKASRDASSSKNDYIIEGYVRDKATSTPVNKASVVVVGGKASALTNTNGFYRLRVTTDKDQLGVSYSKRLYFDTILVIQPQIEGTKQSVELIPRESAPEMMPIRTSLSTKPKEVEELTMVKILVPEPQRELALNFSFLEDIPVQVSLLPSIGTNMLSSGLKTNVVSINVLAGYSAAIEGFEAGGMVNITRTNMLGLQAAGIGNIVGGQVRGIQAGGFFNNVRGSVYGMQAAGFYNLTLDTVRGLQAAGFINVLEGTIQGAQVAGFSNISTENMTGLQAAGFLNYTKKDVKFAQAAGFMNVAGSVSGAQVAGFGNFSTGEVMGAQVAGFMNVAKEITGAQAAGFMNVSGDASSQFAGFINVGKKINGIQLGILNFSDSSNLSIGVLSFSVKGYNHLDFHTDLLQPYNISLRTGSRHFYNILQAGFSSYVGIDLYSLGYGIGSVFGPPEDRINYNLELVGRQIMDPYNKDYPFNYQIKFEPSIAIKIGKKRPSVVVGPSLNWMISDGMIVNQNPDDGKTLSPRKSYPDVYDEVNGRIETDFWVGAKVAFRM